MDNKPAVPGGDSRFERRRFKRINKNYIVSYRIIRGPYLKSNISQTKNVGEGGLMFTTDREFQKGVVLKIKLRLPDFPDYVILKAQVIDSVELAKDLMYQTRVRFIEVEQKVKEGIRKTIDYA